MVRLLVLLLLIGGGVYLWPDMRSFMPVEPITMPAGRLAPQPPYQVPVPPSTFTFQGYQLTTLATYDLMVKVLGKQNYFVDRESDLAPIDLAIGWQQMSDTAVLSKVRIKQQMRWYLYQTDGSTISLAQISLQSANMHIIPAMASIKRQIRALPVGAVIRLRGYLVEAHADDGWTWRSSLTRDDTGAHSCEVMYVNSFERVY